MRSFCEERCAVEERVNVVVLTLALAFAASLGQSESTTLMRFIWRRAYR